MPISRIKTDGINDSAVTLVKTDSLFVNTEISGTEGARMPNGTTAQRASAQSGDIRFNSTLTLMEYYDGVQWKSIDSPPTVSSISPTTVTTANTNITISGLNFQSGATVKFIGNDGTEYNSPSVTVNSNTEIVATTPASALTVANEPYDIQVTNISQLSGVLSDALDAGATPTWTTAAGNIGTIYEDQSISSLSITATDADGQSVAITSSDFSITGVTLNSDGTITGTPNVNDTYASGGVTHTFDGVASDGTNTATRTFNILRRWLDGSTSALAAPDAQSIRDLGITTSGMYYLKASGMGHPAQMYCEMSNYGGGWIYVMQRQCVGDNGLPGSWLTGKSGTPNHATSNFYGVTDTNGTNLSPDDIWNYFIGSSTAGKVYFREIQTSGGSYDESQMYTDASDNAIIDKSNWSKLFYGNHADGTTGVKVHFDNGAQTATGKQIETWSSANVLVTINNGAVDQNIYFCNGEDGGDANWMFGLMKGGTPYPGSANAANGGARGGITRWGIAAIKA
jgi:hypothetical protein